MIQEDYCSFELSKLLKEKGFNWDCEHYYKPNGEIVRSFHTKGSHHINSSVLYEHQCLAPTHQMAMKWLREVHKLFIVIEPEYFEAGRVIAYDFSVWCGDNYKHNFKDNPTYEEAVEAALKYTLENLI